MPAPQDVALWNIDIYNDSLRLYDAIVAFTERNEIDRNFSRLEASSPNHLTAETLNHSLKCISDTIRLYSPHGIFVSFNGGKDATVVLHLYRAVLANFYRKKLKLKLLADVEPVSLIVAPKAAYFLDEGREFEEAKIFTIETAKAFDFRMALYHSTYQEAICDLLKANLSVSSSAHRGLKWQRHPAFLLGVRQGDPNTTDLGIFEPSSDWLDIPSDFMRVHPILKWNYGMVWDFLDMFGLQYCKLYDNGYSSLGTRTQTKVNVRLLSPHGSPAKLGSPFQPARKLEDWSSERECRVNDRPRSNPSSTTS